jgi:hypothetical protein
MGWIAIDEGSMANQAIRTENRPAEKVLATGGKTASLSAGF